MKMMCLVIETFRRIGGSELDLRGSGERSRLKIAPTICQAIVATIAWFASISVISATVAAAEPLPTREAARKLFEDQPRKLERVRTAADALAEIANANPKDYDDQWHAARAWCWLADYGADDKEKVAAANRAIEFAERAIALNERRVEGHYFRGRAIGMLADIERGMKALGRVKEMAKSLERAIQLNEKFDEAGPRRLLGLLLLHTPGWPISIGDKKAADGHIRRATELAPEYPENQTALAQLLFVQKDKAGARAALQKALDAPPWETKQDEDANWKESARRILKENEK
jgi:tetratricopeptide (TPR) repeat protein